MMSTEPVRIERRAGQRFDVQIPISIRVHDRTTAGFSQNISTRGVFLYSEAPLAEGESVELTFTMPSEITLAESMRVRCAGRVLRASVAPAGQKNGTAVHLDSYDYLPALDRVSAPHVETSFVEPVREASRLIPR